MTDDEHLTPLEEECCHMSDWPRSMGSLEQWRQEFREIDRDEHCRNCPLLKAESA
jgi:hypothetical protein